MARISQNVEKAKALLRQWTQAECENFASIYTQAKKLHDVKERYPTLSTGLLSRLATELNLKLHQSAKQANHEDRAHDYRRERKRQQELRDAHQWHLELQQKYFAVCKSCHELELREPMVEGVCHRCQETTPS